MELILASIKFLHLKHLALSQELPSRSRCTKKCDQCVQCDRSVPRAAGRPVWRARASGPITDRTSRLRHSSLT